VQFEWLLSVSRRERSNAVRAEELLFVEGVAEYLNEFVLVSDRCQSTTGIAHKRVVAWGHVREHLRVAFPEQPDEFVEPLETAFAAWLEDGGGAHRQETHHRTHLQALGAAVG